LLVSAATNWLAFALTLAVSFFLAPYLIRKLGDESYGVWGFVESILMYFTLFDLGVTACIVRFVARFHAQRDQTELNRLCSAGMTIFLIAGGCVLLIGLVLVPILTPVLASKAPAAHPVSWFMLLSIVNLALTLPLSVFPSILDGLERYAIKSLVRITFLVGRVSLIVVAMEHEPSLLMLGFIVTASNLLEHLVFAVLAWVYMPGLRFRRSLIDRETMRRVRGYSVDAFLAMIAGRISWQTGAIFLGVFSTAAAITHFLIASRLIDFAKTLLRSATTTLTPAISSLEAQGDHDAIRRILLNGTRWVLYLVLPIHAGLLIFGRPFLTRWLGSSDYAVWCYPSLVILSLTLTFGVVQSIAARVLYGMGKLKLFARFALVEAFVNLGLSIVLVQMMGMEGIAWSIAIPNVVFCAWVVGYTLRHLELSVWEYAKVWVRPCVAITVPLLVWMIVPLDVDAPTWSGILQAGAIGMIPYSLVVLVWESTSVSLIPVRRRVA